MKNKPIIIDIVVLFMLLSYNPVINSESNYIDYIPGFHLTVLNNRILFWKQPESLVPDNGYPVLVLFHGAFQHAFSWFIGLNQWSKSQTIFTEKALEEGFLIIAAESLKPIRPGPRAWDIFNNGSDSIDFSYIKNMIEWLENIDLPVDINRLYCAGFSSGAFMCSYIGYYFSDYFNAVAVHSGANSESISLTNRGPYFDLNASYNFSSSFPQTLIIHGGNDNFVPVQCAENFYSDLQRNDIPSKLLISQDEGHIWISQYDYDILEWFNLY